MLDVVVGWHAGQTAAKSCLDQVWQRDVGLVMIRMHDSQNSCTTLSLHSRPRSGRLNLRNSLSDAGLEGIDGRCAALWDGLGAKTADAGRTGRRVTHLVVAKQVNARTKDARVKRPVKWESYERTQ